MHEAIATFEIGKLIGLQAHDDKEVVAALVKSRKGSKKEMTRKKGSPQ